MRFITPKNIKELKGVPYSDRQLRRLEGQGLFPRRQLFAEGARLKGWPEQVIDGHLEKLAKKSEVA
jgi:hypothetical protein